MPFTLDIDVVGRNSAKVAELLRAVAERVEAGESAGEIADGDEICGEFTLEEDEVGGDDPADEPHDPDLRG